MLDALRELLEAGNAPELLTLIEPARTTIAVNTVMDMARLETGEPYTEEIDRLAQELHLRIINALGDIHITHYFITETIRQFNLTRTQAWFNPQWQKQRRSGDITHFLVEQDMPESNTYPDLRVDSMPRTYRVLLDEPLDADGRNKLDANGSHRMDASGSNSQTRMALI